MRNKNNTNQKQTASIKALLLVFTVVIVSFACGFYAATVIIAAMLAN